MTSFQIRSARPGDHQVIFRLISALADYEKMADRVTGSPEQLAEYLFGAQPIAEVLLAEVPDQPEAVGFALFFPNFSTFLTQPGLYLEDLFVQPAYRQLGIGKALLVQLAQLAVQRGYGRLEWMVLDWNQPAIGFYQRIGAEALNEWIPNRVSGDNLIKLAQGLI
ncbi:MAG: GNAT family N-acetyltransferase [Cyanobacteriota bacterium]|nr:GNAT family N-acetyltransferase [Cyanobacteriota bacterium]